MRKALNRLSGLIAADVKTVAREAWLGRRPPARYTLDGVVLEFDRRVSPPLRREVYVSRTYEHAERQVVQRTLRADDVVLELGAGIGFITTIAARIARELRAYEADPTMARAAAATLVRNGVRATVTHGVLMRSPSSGTASFYLAEHFTSSRLLPTEGTPTVEVPVLDFLEACEGASYLIADIEGGEVELLTGELPGIRAICVECHPALVSAEAITAMLGSLFEQGFTLDLAVSQEQVLYLERR
jgi:FkbM family methyltransferase